MVVANSGIWTIVSPKVGKFCIQDLLFTVSEIPASVIPTRTKRAPIPSTGVNLSPSHRKEMMVARTTSRVNVMATVVGETIRTALE